MTATEQQSGSGTGDLGPDTFDFAAYVTGNSTFPTFKCRVFLDQAGGVAYHEATEQYDALLAERSAILQKQEEHADSAAMSLVDEEVEKLAARLEEVEAELTELGPEIKKLQERVEATALTLHFESGTAQKLASVSGAAEKEFHKKHGRKSDDDAAYVTAKIKHVLGAQLAAYCTEIELADGSKRAAPDANGFRLMLEQLIASEQARLMTTVVRNLDSSADWSEQLDAGFPGRRDEQAAQPVGGAGAEVGEVVGASSDHADDGGGEQLD